MITFSEREAVRLAVLCFLAGAGFGMLILAAIEAMQRTVTAL